MLHPFMKSKLIYDIVTAIAVARNELLGDVVAYTNDPVRFQRRIRMLINLSAYEQQILGKVRDFDTEEITDLTEMMDIIEAEIRDVTNPNA